MLNDKIILQEDLHNLMDWSNRWLLKFHPDKCKAMNIASKPSSDKTYSLNIIKT